MEKCEVKILDIGKGRNIKLPVNYQHFILDSSSTPETMGWKRDDVVYVLKCIQEGHLEDLEMDDDLMNTIGIFFENGVCVNPNIEMAVYWYEQAIENGNDLARSNLADILRKGTEVAREAGAQTMSEVRRAMRLDYFEDASFTAEQAARFA